MVEIKGYKPMAYDDFQRLLHRKKLDEKRSSPEIAVCCGLKDTQTIKNAFNTNKQVVKDAVLSKLMVCLGINGFVHWENGVRYYYVKK